MKQLPSTEEPAMLKEHQLTLTAPNKRPAWALPAQRLPCGELLGACSGQPRVKPQKTPVVPFQLFPRWEKRSRGSGELCSNTWVDSAVGEPGALGVLEEPRRVKLSVSRRSSKPAFRWRCLS